MACHLCMCVCFHGFPSFFVTVVIYGLWRRAVKICSRLQEHPLSGNQTLQTHRHCGNLHWMFYQRHQCEDQLSSLHPPPQLRHKDGPTGVQLPCCRVDKKVLTAKETRWVIKQLLMGIPAAWVRKINAQEVPCDQDWSQVCRDSVSHTLLSLYFHILNYFIFIHRFPTKW